MHLGDTKKLPPFRELRRDQKGMSIVLVLIVIAVIGAAAVTVMSMGNSKRKVSQQLDVSVAANLVKQKLMGIVLSPESWQITQEKNPTAFQAYKANNPKLDLYIPGDSSAPYYQSSNPKSGFDLKGKPCTDFGSDPKVSGSTGNDNCPFRYDITLEGHQNINGAWFDTIHFQLSFKPRTANFLLNTDNTDLSFSLQRNVDSQSVETACISLNGTYNYKTNSCSTQLTTPVAACGEGKTYRGPAGSSGKSNCDSRAITATVCSSDKVVKGFDDRGNVVCGAPL